jgi:ATPase subunit of ABC transporter with duplicated ATPase domains
VRTARQTILLVSHDRQLLADAVGKIITLEANGAWTHGGSFDTYVDARDERLARLDERHRYYREERRRLEASMKELKRRAAISDANTARAKAAVTKLRRFEENEKPPERPQDRAITVRLGGDRTGKRALTIEGLELEGLTYPFDTEVWFGERVAVVGANGTGKSHFLRLLAGQHVGTTGEWRLGARVVPGFFSQNHDHPELRGRQLLSVLADHNLARGPAMAALRRYQMESCADQPFETLSGGQQARFQVLLLELAGATMLLLDEPTDNLDLASAEALQEGLANFTGTVLAVTHDRWFMRGFDRYLVFAKDGEVRESFDPAWD